jgi:RNA polymerase sigma factor (sigma-70 family)
MAAHTTSNESSLLTAFLAYRSALFNTVVPIVGCRHWAEDVVQDVYLKITESGVSGEIHQPVSYLFRMVRNLAIDRSRRLALEGRYNAGDEAANHVLSTEPSPEQITVDRDTLKHLANALEELPERTRMAFEMYRFGDCTQQQIAKQLGVSPTLVHFLIRDALNHCRARLARSD